MSFFDQLSPALFGFFIECLGHAAIWKNLKNSYQLIKK